MASNFSRAKGVENWADETGSNGSETGRNLDAIISLEISIGLVSSQDARPPYKVAARGWGAPEFSPLITFRRRPLDQSHASETLITLVERLLGAAKTRSLLSTAP